MFSQAEENYLKAIFILQNDEDQMISTNLIAAKMNTRASSVTDMVKRLAAKKLISYKKYQGVFLSEKGKEIALMVIRKHRLWELFLVEKLNYQWDEVHDIAEQLEHIKSESLVNNLDDFLGNPKFDPHGDPIPDRNGKMMKTKTINLLQMETGSTGVLESVKNSSNTFLKYLNQRDLALGDRIMLLEIEDFDQSVLISSKGTQFMISRHAAANLCLKIVKDEI